MTRSGKILTVLGFAVFLSSLIIPLSNVRSISTVMGNSGNISIGIGIMPYVGVELVDATPNADANVTYDDTTSTYIKTMINGESIPNFGTSTFRIYCNTYNTPSVADLNLPAGEPVPDVYKSSCREKRWSLLVSPAEGSTFTKDGTTYAAMTHDTMNSFYAIPSISNVLDGSVSTWTILVSADPQAYQSTNTTPKIEGDFGKPSIIPTEETPIATGSSFVTIDDEIVYTGSSDVKVQYGISLSNSQASGTYTGGLVYTVSL